MPTIYIDGKKIETTPDKTVIQAAFDNGIEIPHFCWHPELSVSGNCRMCLVEIGTPKMLPDGTPEVNADGNPAVNYMPKLQIACATRVSEGLHVRTKTDAVIKSQEAVMEFFLINHPLDCPICDEAGQCKLQEYAFDHSTGESRFEENKNIKDKRVSWGKHVMYDGERCISCSRCIRFAKETAKQDVLTFVNRGDKVLVKVADGETWDNPYSMNVIDICPVGALTSKDFRFKSRVWEMTFNDSICTACARGCNIKLGVRNNEILRVDPSANSAVNKNWMCDRGRTELPPKANRDRIIEPLVRTSEGFKTRDFESAARLVFESLSKFKPSEIMIVASPFSSNETLYSLAGLAKKSIKTPNIDFIRRTDKSMADDFLRCEDITPNTKGAELIGIAPGPGGIGTADLAGKIKEGKIKAVLAVEEDFETRPDIVEAIDKLEFFAVCASGRSAVAEKAGVILPASITAESEGTFVNIDGRVQHFEPALVTKENLSRAGMKMSRQDKFGAFNDRWTAHDTRNTRPSWMIIQMIALRYGTTPLAKKVEEVFRAITAEHKEFESMTYSKLDKYLGLILGKGSAEEKIKPEYSSHSMRPH